MAKNKLLARAASFGLRTVGLKRASWNLLSRSGIAYSGPSPVLAGLISSMSTGGLIVEHGCGTGTLPGQLKPGAFRRYIGYDISDASIAVANARKQPGCLFARSSMEEWVGEPEPVDMVICKEVLYYLSAHEMRSFLSRARQALAPGGSVIVTVYDRARHGDAVEICAEYGSREVHSKGASVVLAIGRV